MAQQPMWRIGSQTPPSRMMIPWAVAAGAACAAAGADVPMAGVAASDGVPNSAAATTAVGSASNARRRMPCGVAGFGFGVAGGVHD